MMSGQIQTEVRTTAASEARVKARRRLLATSEKLQIVEATLAPNASVAGIALAHGINTNLVFKWRRLYQKGLLGEPAPSARLMPVQIADPAAAEIATARPARRDEGLIQHSEMQGQSPRTSAPGAIHVQLPNAQLHIEGAADVVTLRAVLEMLRG